MAATRKGNCWFKNGRGAVIDMKGTGASAECEDGEGGDGGGAE